ncbi:MAG TPA: TIGR03435 family protein [Mucilaginibacter sp.]|nr:TIGR03435 family protein [Mucilaginibacter sp.]
MKKIALLVLILLLSHGTFAQLKNGELVPEINFVTVLNAPVKQTALSTLKGKVVLIEYWATWCGSCIVAMPHLKQLQEKFPDKLQVITVTDETAKRTGQFLAVKPSNLWFAVDTARAISAVFPHQLIPHTVLIDQDGKLVANTSPEFVTEKVIDSILSRQIVHLPEKKDNPMDYDEIIKTYFSAADTVQHRFMMLPKIPGAPGLSTTWLTDSVFSGRRLTCLNVGLSLLYRLANNNFPYGRTIDKTGDDPDKSPAYCLDIIVPEKADLLPTLRKELAKRFDLQAKIDPQIKDVYVLTITDSAKFKKVPRNTSGKRTYYARHGEIDQQDMTMTDFADYLESFGIVSRPVIDETGNHEKLDIKFSFQPENPASLTKVLSDMGLKLEQAQRTVNMLVLSKEKSI